MSAVFCLCRCSFVLEVRRGPLTVAQVAREFGLRTYAQYIAQCTAEQQAARQQEARELAGRGNAKL